MKLSDSLNTMELCDVCFQYQLDKDVPVFIRNLIATLSNYSNPEYHLRKLYDNVQLYQPKNKNLPYYKWYDSDEITKIIEIITGLSYEKCYTELKRTLTWERTLTYGELCKDSKTLRIPILCRNFYFKGTKKRHRLMVRTQATINENGRRDLYRRNPRTHNIELVSEQLVKEELIVLNERS